MTGWGAKSAAALLDRWGHLENIPDDPLTWDAGVRGAAKLNAALRGEFDLALLFRHIATVRTDAEVGSVDEWRWAGPGRRCRSGGTRAERPQAAGTGRAGCRT